MYVSFTNFQNVNQSYIFTIIRAYRKTRSLEQGLRLSGLKQETNYQNLVIWHCNTVPIILVQTGKYGEIQKDTNKQGTEQGVKEQKWEVR